jgi:transcriptional regulator of arginine metabolism
MERLEILRDILTSGFVGTQDELCDKLSGQGYEVTQSTISRDLRRLGAVKAIDDQGRTVYRFTPELAIPVRTASLSELVTRIETNGAIIVIHTTLGSASLVALHLDRNRPAGILGTIAGDDTIFVAPASLKGMPATIESIRESMEPR